MVGGIVTLKIWAIPAHLILLMEVRCCDAIVQILVDMIKNRFDESFLPLGRTNYL